MQTESAARQHSVDKADALQASAQPQQDRSVDKWWLSESSEDEDEGRIAQQQPPDESDLLYDPQADDEDEKWVQKQRQGHATDAILSCPGCFTTLCIDCQQHAHYHTQYRALITMNCEVKADQPMQSQVQRMPRQQQQQRRKKRRVPEDIDDTPQQQGGPSQQHADADSEVLYPVCCEVCGTQVGAQDSDKMVHFFHVLASEC